MDASISDSQGGCDMKKSFAVAAGAGGLGADVAKRCACGRAADRLPEGKGRVGG